MFSASIPGWVHLLVLVLSILVGVVVSITQRRRDTHQASVSTGYAHAPRPGRPALVQSTCERVLKVRWRDYIIVGLSDFVRWLKREWDYDTDIIDLIDCYHDYQRTEERYGRDTTQLLP